MALRARLVAPSAPPPEKWPWHKAKWLSLPLHDLLSGDRRMEAESYLSSGYGIRLAIEGKARGWRRLDTFAHVSQPLRLKGILVGSGDGVPFLAATQVFDIRPVPRKWLALERTENAAGRFVHAGQILVTRSGAVGRTTLASACHENILISDDLLRVDAREPAMRGWLYAYLRAPQTRAMMSSAQYGHIIKHLETAHLDALPVPEIDAATAADFERRVLRLLELRNQSYRHTLEAERLFEKALGPLGTSDLGEGGFTVRASQLTVGRRRLDGAFSSPRVAAIKRHLASNGRAFSTLAAAGYDVWVPNRYKRITAADGVRYLDSADLLEVSPDGEKRFAECGFGDQYQGRVKRNWLLMPSSGQVYGIIGSLIMAGAALEDSAVSNHVIRIAYERGDLSPGFLLTAMSHPVFGRPLIKALAFGSSVPEIDTEAVRAFQVVRLGLTAEAVIAGHAEASAEARALADALERELAEDAGQLIDQFLSSGIVGRMKPALREHDNTARPIPLVEHARVRLREGLPKYHLRAGTKGTIVHVYGHGKGLEVEFGASGKSPKVVTLDGDAVEPLVD